MKGRWKHVITVLTAVVVSFSLLAPVLAAPAKTVPVKAAAAKAAEDGGIIVEAVRDKVLAEDGTKYSTSGELPVRSAANKANSLRSFVEFEITDELKSGNWNQAFLELYISRVNSNYNKQAQSTTGTYGDRNYMEVHTLKNSWDDGMTWGSWPEAIEVVSGGSRHDVTGTKGAGGIKRLDISYALKKAMKEGKDSICLMLSFPQIDKYGSSEYDNGVYFAGIGSSVSGAFVPRIVAENTGNDEQIEAVQERWQNYLRGGSETLDLEDEAVIGYLRDLKKSADGIWASMIKSNVQNRTLLWTDLPITVYTHLQHGANDGTRDSSGNIGQHFSRLFTLAKAYATYGCEGFYQDTAVRDEIILGLKLLNDKYYNTGANYYGNWYHWEITVPQAAMGTLMVMRDVIPEDVQNNISLACARFNTLCNVGSGYPGSPSQTGANLFNKSEGIALDGVLNNRGYKLEHIRDAQKTVFVYIDDEPSRVDGFYKDGSYIQHSSLAYTTGYGVSLFTQMSKFFYILSGSDWRIEYPEHEEYLIYDMIFEAVEPLIFDGQAMDMTSGRAIVRNSHSVLSTGAELIEAMIPVGVSIPDSQMRERFQSMIKYFILADEEYYFSKSSDLVSRKIAMDILNDDKILPRNDYSIHKTYAGMDRVVHSRPDYAFGLSMSSARRSKYEMYNQEGKAIWNIADGTTYMYTDDREQYANGYWAAVDMRRLPGITTEYFFRGSNTSSQNEFGKTKYDWAGGSTLGLYGTAGVQMQSFGNQITGNGSALNGVEAKKSWFMFDDEIVALGTDIKGNQNFNYNIETIIDNRRLHDLDKKVIVDGNEPDIYDAAVGTHNDSKNGTTLENVTWANIEGNTPNSSMGYYFPEQGTSIQAMKEHRTGNYNRIGTADHEAEGDFAALWFSHGIKPFDASYQYVILPGMNAEETAAYAVNPKIEVLENNTDVQAVRHTELGITGINFWNNKTASAGQVTSNRAASVTMQIQGENLALAVSDPTWKNTGKIELTVAVPAEEIIECDSTITVLERAPFLKIAVDVSNSRGKSHLISIKGSMNTLSAVSVEEVENMEVPVGTAYEDLNLPEKLKVYLSDATQYEAEVIWNREGYYGDIYGKYAISGELKLPENIQNPYNLRAVVIVQVGKLSVEAVQDTYVRDRPLTSSNTDYTGAHNKNSEHLVVKNDKMNAQGYYDYSRKSWIQFDISEVPEDSDKVYFMLEAVSIAEDFTDCSVYLVESGYDQDTLTWKNFPNRVHEEYIGQITKELISQEKILEFDITDLIKEAQQRDETEMAFELFIDNYSAQNTINICSLENKQGMAPTIQWEKSLPVELDYSFLEEEIEAAKDTEKKLDQYMENGKEDFQTALNDARNMLEMRTARNQPQIEEMIAKLLNARMNLRLKPNKTALNDLIGELEKLIAAEYTKASFAVLQNVLSNAYSVMDNPLASQNDIDNAIKLLEYGRDQLIKLNDETSASEESKETGESQKSSESNSTEESQNTESTEATEESRGKESISENEQTNDKPSDDTNDTQDNTGNGSGKDSKGGKNGKNIAKTGDSGYLGIIIMGLISLCAMSLLFYSNKKNISKRNRGH